MIIPVRCFSCGKIMADKYRAYLNEVSELKKGTVSNEYFHPDITEKTPEAIVLDRLGLFRQCCRRHMLTHVDIE
jgi:DNA-directed RNA polymerase I, II, and III subunit RPABC5